jgi:hypothetical protein
MRVPFMFVACIRTPTVCGEAVASGSKQACPQIAHGYQHEIFSFRGRDHAVSARLAGRQKKLRTSKCDVHKTPTGLSAGGAFYVRQKSAWQAWFCSESGVICFDLRNFPGLHDIRYRKFNSPPTTASSSASLKERISAGSTASVVSMFVVLLVIDTSFRAANVALIRTPTVCGEVAASGSKQTRDLPIAPGYQSEVFHSVREITLDCAAACRLGAEGIVSKRAGSAYLSGRNPAWVKEQCEGYERK